MTLQSSPLSGKEHEDRRKASRVHTQRSISQMHKALKKIAPKQQTHLSHSVHKWASELNKYISRYTHVQHIRKCRASLALGRTQTTQTALLGSFVHSVSLSFNCQLYAARSHLGRESQPTAEIRVACGHVSWLVIDV